MRKVLAAETSFACADDRGRPRAPLTGRFACPLVQGGKVPVIPGVPAAAPDVPLYRTGR